MWVAPSTFIGNNIRRFVCFNRVVRSCGDQCFVNYSVLIYYYRILCNLVGRIVPQVTTEFAELCIFPIYKYCERTKLETSSSPPRYTVLTDQFVLFVPKTKFHCIHGHQPRCRMEYRPYIIRCNGHITVSQV